MEFCPKRHALNFQNPAGEAFDDPGLGGTMLTNTTEIGTATLPRRRLTIPAPTDVSPSAPRQPPRFPALAQFASAARRVPRAPIPVAFALAVLAVLATVAPEPAAAQTVTTFISNTGQTTNFASSFVQATEFTTGTGTYTLSSVGIFIPFSSLVGTPAVKIYGDTGGNPGTTLLATMTNPGTFADNAVHTFTAPANTTLSASTTYWVVTSNSAATNGQGFRVGVVDNTTLDTGAAAGWSIGAARLKSDIAATSWTPSSRRIRFAIRGTGGTTTNNPPTVATAIPDQSATAGTAFSYAFPDTTFSDADTGDTLSYTATKTDDTDLPLWLAFAASTRTFSGTPQAADIATVAVKVTASDGNGGSVSDAFDITVSAAADTTPPTLTSADVEITDALIINLVFSEDLQLSNRPALSAFTVTVDGSAATVSSVLVPGSVLPQNELWLQLSTAIRQRQAVVVTYTDATSGDDTAAIQDTAGNDAATFTTGMDGVPAVTNNSTVTNTVPADWSLIPTGLSTGDKFRLLFLSSTKRTASSTDIADYNTFIQTRAAAGHTDIQDYSADFRAVGCTAAVDARDNTATTYTTTDKGVPIYWLNGAKAADQYEDFYDGSWDDEANDKNESGTNGPDTSQNVNYPWTGCDHDGTEAVTGVDSFALGTGLVDARVGRPNSSGSNVGPLNGQTNRSDFQNSPLYGLSAVFQVAAAVVVPNNPPTVANAIPDQSATAGTAFSYVFPDTTFSDADTSDTLTYTATKADDTALPTWLAFAAGTRTFSGTPTAAETVSVKVTASDGNGGSVSDTFDITVAADTTPPTLTGASIEETDGLIINLRFSEDLQLSNPPPVSAFTVTVDGSAATVSSVLVPGSVLPQNDLWLQLSTAIRQGQAVVVAYADPTTGDDANAIQDAAGNDAADFTTGMNGVPAVTNNSLVTNTPATGAPTITGTAQVGQTLTAGTTAIVDADGLTSVSYTYQWIRVATDNTETNISGATASTYTLVAADQGTTIKVRVSFTDDASNAETLTSAATAAVSADTTPPTLISATVVPNGSIMLFQFSENLDGSNRPPVSAFTVTAGGNTITNSSTSQVPGSRDGVALSFSPPYIRQGQTVVLTYTDPTGGNDANAIQDTAGNDVETFTTDLNSVPAVINNSTLAPVAPGAPTGLTATASGSTQIDLSWTAPADNGGRVITGYKIEISPNGTDTWTTHLADTTSTNTTYAHTGLAASTTRHYRVSAINTIGTSAASNVDDATTGAGTNTAATGAPTITGTAQVGQTLTAGTTAIMDAEGLTSVSYTYQWIRTAAGVDTNISGATASTYTLVAADLGTTIKVTVSFTDDASNAETLTSNVSVIIARPANTAATGKPGITGTAQVGQTLTATVGTSADVDGLPNPFLTDVNTSFQWIRVATDNSETNIASATASTYTLVAADLGTTIKVKVGFADYYDYDETLTSDATAAVAASTNGICSRTQQVRDAIVGLVSGVTHCADVTDAHLAAITGPLNLGNKGITALAAGDFDGLTALTTLYLNNNSLTTLPAGVFDELTALTELDLGANDLTTLPAGVFDGLTALTVLRMGGNSLATLPAGVFDELTALTGLYLGGNSLSTLPAGVFEDLTALTLLQLRSNPGAPFSPTADALPDDGTVLDAGGDVTLDGSGSDGGPWGTNVTYSWAASGAAVTFDDAASATPVVTIPALTAGTELTFTLTVTGRATDTSRGTAPDTDNATVTATATNAAPAFTSSATFSAAENQTAAGTVEASDSDAGDSVTGYEIQGGADRSKFSIGAASGVLTFRSAPNFEDATDDDASNTYVVVVRATSGTGARAKTADQTITVTVTDVDGEAPGVPGAPTVASASVSSLTAAWAAPANAGPPITDYDYRYQVKSTPGWTEVTNTTITALSATITELAEDTEYEVQVRATNDEGTSGWSDSGSASTDANAAPAFTSSATFSAAENQTAAGTVEASDSDAGDSVTGYEIQGGADRSKFSIGAASGVLTFRSAPNFEDATDDDASNTYVVVVRATSGTGARAKTADQTITVTVTDVDGEAPGVPGAPTVASASVSSLTAAWAAPANAGPPITDYDYRYQVKSTPGWTEVTNTTITALSATITELAEDTEYEVQVRATNDEGTSGWSDSGSASTDANAAPAFTSSATFSAAENQTAAGTVEASDSDAGDSVTGYEIQGGADRSKFSIGAASGVLTFRSAPNFEDATDDDASNTYVVVVRATSGTGARAKTADQTITVTVTDVDGEAPGVPGAPTVASASVSSLTAAWAAPANAGPPITDYDYRYQVKSTPGWTEVTNTTITALSATITELAEDTEYEVQVRATNDEGTSGWSDSGSASTDANAAPAFTSSATFSAAENQTAAGTVEASDSDAGDSVTGYEIQGGADRSKFSIGAASGVLTFRSAPNFEDATDDDASNTYVVVVRATSGTGARAKTADQTITVTVTDVDGEAPGVPGAPTVASASVSSLTAAWAAPANAGPPITDYDYRYQVKSTPGWTEVTNTTITALSATITELAEDTEYEVQVRATNDEGTSGWSDSDSASTAITNTPATGAPTITGTAQVGQTLTAGTTAIMDAEGLTSVSYTYQWIRVDGGTETNISGATASTYTLVAADQGTTIKVTVSFTDDASNAETLTSAATAAVSAAPNTPATGAPTITGTAQVGQTLTAGTTAIMDAEGLTSVSYTYQWIRVDGGTETNISGATASTYTLVAADQGTTIKVTVSFTDDASNAETLTSAATAAVSAAPNTPATGAPTITGTAQVGQTLTADTTAIMDAEGLTSVSYTYQWIRVDGGTETNISGATASTHTLVAADQGTTIKVKVSFTDDASNPETLTSAATAVVTATTGQTTVTFGASSYTATEGGAAATVTVALSAAPSASVTIPLTTAHLNGATAADHAGIPATVTFGTNQTVMTFTVTATDDADTDGGESVQLGFGTLPGGYAPGARRTATVTLVDNDANLIVNFGTERHTTVKVLESDTVWHRFIFSLSTSRDGPPNGNPQQPVTIPLVVTHRGGAKAEEDYEGIPKSVTFEVGQSVTDFSMRAIPDGKREPGEGLRLDFGPLPAGVRKGTWGPYETIAFVDQVLPGYTVLFGAEAYTATEGGAPARVSIHLNEPVEIEPLVVGLVVTHVGATAADYTGIPKSVRFGVGEQTQTITVTATDDTDDDDGESVTLSFVNDPNGRVRVGTGPASATVALADNDGTRRVTVSFGAVTYTATEGGADATVRVELDAAPGRPVTVPLTKAHLGNATAADYSGIPMNVTFAANQTSRTFAVMATAGDGSDGGESVSIGFGTLPEGVFAGSPAATTVTLADGGEQRLVVNFGSSRGHTVQVREGARRLRLNVLLDSSPRRPVTIPLVVTHVGGATEADYAAIPESVTFAAGQTSAHYYVRALPDEEDETGEGLQLDFGPLPPGVRKGTWGPYETIDFLDPAPAALLPAFAAFRLLTSGNASAQDSVESDRAVLVALYNATDGPNWTGNTHWLSNEPLSEWRGVGVNDDGRVTALWLFGNQLTGEIPVELSQLSQLQLLYLSSNQLTGEIPVELSQLSQLQDLSLYNNQLTGEIPVELSQLSQLQLLYLSSNQLTGEIPAELGNLAQLNGLYLHGNELNGPIPSWLVNLTELRELSLWSNQLTGTIPPEVAPAQDRAALVVLYLQTDGPNWTDNTNWARSREPLSEWHGVSTDEQGRVEELRLSSNGLNGTIGAELGVLTRLAGLYLNDNELTGTIPPELENLTQLQVFDIRNTGLCVTADSELHTWIATIQDFQGTATCGASNLVANFSNGNNGAFNSRVYLWNPSESSGDVTVRVFTLPLTGGLAQELTAAPLNLGTLGAKSALNLKLAEDILTPLGITLPYTTDGGNLTLEFTIEVADVRGAAQVFSSSFAFGAYPLQEIPSTSSGSPTVLVANFMNGNSDAFSSRAYLFNPSDSDGNVTVRVFTLPFSDGTAQELTGTPLDLGTLEARSALNLKLAEDILTPLGITLPYTTDGGNLTLEFTIEVADVRGAAQVFSSSFAFGAYPLQEIPSTSSGSPTVLVANFMNGNSDAFSSRAYLFNPSDSDGTVTVRVFTLPLSDGTAQELTGTPLDLGTLGARSALNLKLVEDILIPLGIALPYTTDGGNLTLEFTIQAADARGAAQVFSSDFAFGTYPMQEIPSTSSGSPTVLVANFMNGNDAALNSRVYLWNPSLSAGNVTVRVFTLPLTAGVAQELTAAPLDLGTLGAESARNLKLVEDILTPLGIPTPYVTDGGNLTLEFTIQAADVRGAAQVFSSSLAFGTVPLQVIQ